MNEEFQEIHNDATMTAGEMLRVARTTGRRKREIPTISKQLCIREEFLEALENGDYSVLPEAVYILGFARNYAMELGLDPDVIVAKIKKEMGIDTADAVASHQNVPEKTEVESAALTEKIAKKLSNVGKTKSCKLVAKYWKWFVGGIAALIVATIIITVLVGKPEVLREEVPAPVQEIIVESPVVPVKVEPEYKQPVRERFGVENREDAEVVLQAVQESWVKIEDARGKTVFSRVLVPGDLYYVPVTGKNKATFGNAGAIDIWVRGELAPKAGEANTRKTGIALDADSLMNAKKSGK
ncbi:MAG: DUF4115 domain-containing protein [Alphaproteobacteria bacterium]|nr:DUF4115 domain-containing protein [Alphaproteobacteria bacterium]